jgi:RHS repeat-associated protein
MGRYTFTVAGAAITFGESQASVWFGGKLVQKYDGGSPSNVFEDRLGSVGKYLPYGEAKPGASGNPAGDNEKFATYTRDAGTGLDYADQRWHVAGAGRFLTADPYQASGGASDPGSWNRFGYVGGDPTNWVDVSGLLQQHPCKVDPTSCEPDPWPDPHTPHDEPDPNAQEDNWREKQKESQAKRDAMRARRNLERNKEAKAKLNALHPDCQALLANVQRGRSQSLEGAIDNTAYVDTPLSSLWTMTDLGYQDSTAIVNVIYNFRAIAGQGDAAGIVILNSVQYGASGASSDNGAMLIHEALHGYLGMNDIDLAKELFGYVGKSPGDASREITRRLNGKCEKGQ